jgi:septal ring factor EnvC (AmiA/AmiB activator)
LIQVTFFVREEIDFVSAAIKKQLNVFLRDIHHLHKAFEDVLKESDAAVANDVQQLQTDVAKLQEELERKNALLQEIANKIQEWDVMLEKSEVENQVLQSNFC